MNDTANQNYPCHTCENAQRMSFQRHLSNNQTSLREEVFCLSIHKLLDDGLPVSCSGYKPRSQTE